MTVLARGRIGECYLIGEPERDATGQPGERETWLIASVLSCGTLTRGSQRLYQQHP
jgi:hypothetical protein